MMHGPIYIRLSAEVTCCLPVVPTRYSNKHQQQLLLKMLTHYVKQWVSDAVCEVKQRMSYMQSTCASDHVFVTKSSNRLPTYMV